MTRVSLSTVIVAHDSLADLRRCLPALLEQLGGEDELIIVDNASRDGLADELPTIAAGARLVRMAANEGFAAGANRGAAEARGDLLVLLNPDAVVQPGWSEAIRAPWGGEWAAWMGLVVMRDGREINTSGGVLHFTGFGWAGQIGEPVGAAVSDPAEVGFLSGACLAIPRETWLRLGGFPAQFFMYCEDVDLSLRLRLCGGKLAVMPGAVVAHDYEFAKGELKWRLLERNRLATVIRTYPGSLLLLVLPALLAVEAAVWVTAIRGGWARAKLQATRDLLRALPRLARERREIQAASRIPASAFAAHMTAELSSPYFGLAGAQRQIRTALSLYWRAVRALLR
jgi:GT2 family glycosyltransferase